MKPCKGREGSSCDKNNNCTYPECKLEYIKEIQRKAQHDLIDRYEEKIQSKVPELRKLVN